MTKAALYTAWLWDRQELSDFLSQIARPCQRWSLEPNPEGFLITVVGREQTLARIAGDLIAEWGPRPVRPGNLRIAECLLDTLRSHGSTITCAESCTGGLVSKLITDIPGCSEAFKGGAVVYSNPIKQHILHVSDESLQSVGAVSAQVVGEMAHGGLVVFGADVALAVSGVAGPTGGSKEKPVGTVWIAVHHRDGREDCRLFRFHGSRIRVRVRAAVSAILMAEAMVDHHSLPSLPDESGGDVHLDMSKG